MSDEEITCPKERLEELCQQSAPCRAYLQRYEECSRRVASNPGSKEACTEELFDLSHCVDQCVRGGSASGPRAVPNLL